MNQKILLKELRSSKEFFDRSTRVLTEDDSTFTPVGGTMSVAQQVAHVASTVDWFVAGAFDPKGFDLDFEAHNKKIMASTSLKKSREWLERSFAAAVDKLQSLDEKALMAPMAPGMVMGGEPRIHAFLGIVEHTAHHRGALTVYTRLLGKVPPMPYLDM